MDYRYGGHSRIIKQFQVFSIYWDYQSRAWYVLLSEGSLFFKNMYFFSFGTGAFYRVPIRRRWYIGCSHTLPDCSLYIHLIIEQEILKYSAACEFSWFSFSSISFCHCIFEGLLLETDTSRIVTFYWYIGLLSSAESPFIPGIIFS